MKHLIFVLIFAVTIVTGCTENNENRLEIARTAIAENDFRLATVTLKSILQQDRDIQDARALLGLAQLKQGLFVAALSDFNKLNQDYKQKFLGDMFAAAVHAESFNEVIQYDKSDLELNDKSIAFFIFAAIELGDVDLATQSADKLGDSSYGYLGRAFIASKNGQLQTAIQYAKKSLFADPDNIDTTWFLGIMYQQLGSFNEAFETFNDYKATRERDLRVVYFLAQSALGANRYEDAEKYASMLTNIVDNHPAGNFILGITSLKDNNFVNTSKYSAYAIRSDDIRLKAKLLSGISNYSLAKYEVAFNDLYDVAVVSDINHPAVGFLLATALSMRDSSAIKRVKDEIFDGEDTNFGTVMSQILIELANNETDYVITPILYDSLVRLFPKDASSVIAQNMLAKKLNKSVVTSLDEMLVDSPDNESILITRIYEHLKSGELVKAEKLLVGISDKSVSGHVDINIAFLKKDYEQAYKKSVRLIQGGFGAEATLNLALASAEKLDKPEYLSTLQALGETNNWNIFPVAVTQFSNFGTLSSKNWIIDNLNQQSNVAKLFLIDQLSSNGAQEKLLELVSPEYAHDINDPITKQLILILLSSGDSGKLTKFVLGWSNEDKTIKATEVLVRLLKGKKEHEQLINYVEPLVNDEGTTLVVQKALLDAYIWVGEIEKAQLLIRQLVELYPFDGDLLYQLSRLEAAEGDLSDSMVYLEQAYAAKPSQKIAMNYAYSMLKNNEKERTISFLLEHKKSHSDHYDLIHFLAMLSVENRPDIALECYLSLPLRELSKNSNSLNNVAFILIDKGEAEKANYYIDLALKKEPENKNFLDTKAKVDKALTEAH